MNKSTAMFLAFLLVLPVFISAKTGKVFDNQIVSSKILKSDRKYSINSGNATPMIIVMPDATSGRSGYFNDIRGDWNYEDFFFQELIPFIEKKYRVKSIKRSRAISGLSMGGGGTFMYALHHPEMFSAAYPISAYIGPANLEAAKIRLKTDELKLADSVIEKYYEQHNAISLINNMPDDQKKAVKWYID